MIDINICQIDGACGIALELSYTSNYRSHVHSQRTTNIKSKNCTTMFLIYLLLILTGRTASRWATTNVVN